MYAFRYKEMKIHELDAGHMTNMAATPIYVMIDCICLSHIKFCSVLVKTLKKKLRKSSSSPEPVDRFP